MLDAIYVIFRGDTDWTLLYLGRDYRKIHTVEAWAAVHCQRVKRIRILDNHTCFMDEKIFRQKFGVFS